MNRTLFEALWLEKMAVSITIGLIVWWLRSTSSPHWSYW